MLTLASSSGAEGDKKDPLKAGAAAGARGAARVRYEPYRRAMAVNVPS